MSLLQQIKASAGSGKTYTITRQYVDRLQADPEASFYAQGVSAIDEILASTFTNAATMEMRASIIRRLKKTALGLEPDEKLGAAEAKKWINAILYDLNAMNVRTIDSLIHQIVRTSALDLGLNPDFKTVFNIVEAFAPVLDAFIERAAEDGDQREELRALCQSLQVNVCAKGFLAGKKILSHLEAVIEDVLLERLGSLSSQEEARAKKNQLRDIAIASGKKVLELAEKSGLNLRKPQQRMLEAGVDNVSLPAGAKKTASEFFNTDTVDEDAASAFSQWREAITSYFHYSNSLNSILNHIRFVEFAEKLSVSFKQGMADDGVLPNMLFPLLAARLLATGVSNAICRLGNRLTHFLVDEFQDTSREQWAVLKMLAEEALSRGGSLTCVGDVKQSIYGWRGGEPTLFDEVFADRSLTAMAPKPVLTPLKRNWRSFEKIVEHTNMIFSRLTEPAVARQVLEAMLPSGAPEKILDYATERIVAAYGDVKQICAASEDKKADEGLVHAEMIASESAAELDIATLARLGELVKEISSRRPLSDILILVRSNEKGRQVAEYLLDLGISVITENSLLLKEHPLIIQTVAFLEFLDNPENDVAFLAMISGRIFLEHPAAGGLDKKSLAEWLFNADQSIGAQPVQSLAKIFMKDFPEQWRLFIEPFHNQASLMTPYDLVMEWYAHLDVENRFKEDLTFLRRFMEILHVVEKDGFGSTTSFLEFWNGSSQQEKAPLPPHMEAARIMTIHKAKGLEAPVAILPWTNFAIEPSRKLFAYEDGCFRIPLAMKDKFAGEKYYEDFIKQVLEAINLFYVALTRPREELYIFHSVQANSRKKYLGKIYELLLESSGIGLPPYEIGSLPIAQPHPVPDSEKKDAGPAAYSDDSLPPPQANDVWRPMQWLPGLKIFRNKPGMPTLTPTERGTFLHFCLERIDPAKNPEDAAKAALDFGIRYSGINVPDDEKLRSGLFEALNWFASIPAMPEWFKNGWPEHSMLAEDGMLMRADLVIPHQGGVVVIDYKSGEPSDGYIGQLRKYLACIAQSGSFAGDAVGLLVFLDKKMFQFVTLNNTSEYFREFSKLSIPGL